MSDAERVLIQPELIPSVVETCTSLIDEFGQIISDARFPATVRSVRGKIVPFVSSGSIWHKLRVGEAVLNLQLYHCDDNEPPHSLEVLNEQTGRWPDSICIEYPAVSDGVLSVRSALNRSPNAGNYEIRPDQNEQSLQLFSYDDSHSVNLFQHAGVSGVQGLWDALERQLAALNLIMSPSMRIILSEVEQTLIYNISMLFSKAT